MKRAGADAGFLLAETLITFALSALVLVGLVSAAAVLLRATDRSVAAVDAADDLGRTLDALRRDVSQLKRVRWSGEEPRPFVFRGGPNSLFFAQEAPVADGGRELRVVSFREVQAGRSTSLIRAEAHLSAAASGWGDLAFGSPRATPTGPARLRFRYLAEAAPDARRPPPVDAWPSGPTLPAAVIVEAVEPGSTRLLVSERIPVRADADIGCVDKRPLKRDANAATPPGAAPQPGQAGAPSAQGQPGAPPPQSVAGAPAQPGQAGAPPTPGAPGSGFSLDETNGVANKNEFCGRADKGIARKADAAAPGPTL